MLASYIIYVEVLLPLEHNANKSKAVVRFSKSLNVESAFARMTSQIENILEMQKFSKLRRACVQRINSLGSNLPQSLIPKIQHTATLDEMLDVLAWSPYWNWFDTRLLQALVSASGSPEAEEWLEVFKATFYSKKVTEVIPYVSIKPFNESIDIIEKFDKNPKDLTISELLEHKYKLEHEILDINEGDLVLSCIKTGCVKLTWKIPQELVYRAYTSMKRKHDELSSLAVKSLVCEEADEYAGLPILWRGQEVGEVGPIEPLPEHVRQEPYSLPQGFEWVNLSSSDAEEVKNFSNKLTSYYIISEIINFILMHPNKRSEWYFGIRATNGKLVGVVLANPVCINIGGVSLTCVYPLIVDRLKYRGKRLWYVLVKELMRRVNLCNINHSVISMRVTVLKPISTMHRWIYSFNHPTSSQLPSSPRTPGWRRMTSEDVPSALALINKWSSQFEIRQVFKSEEEFAHYFLDLHPPASEHVQVFTYVVQNKANNITDIVRYLQNYVFLSAFSTLVISTCSPAQQLLMDALVCARNSGATSLTIKQHDIESDILSSLSFQQLQDSVFHTYNYKYFELPNHKVWFAP